MHSVGSGRHFVSFRFCSIPFLFRFSIPAFITSHVSMPQTEGMVVGYLPTYIYTTTHSYRDVLSWLG